jgi:hypothetical protein
VADYIIKTNERREIIRYILPNTIKYIYTLLGFVKGLTTIFREINKVKKVAITLQILH